MSILMALESPKKIKDVQKYVGPDYYVCASKGHIREISKRKDDDYYFGINLSNNFNPEYKITQTKTMVVTELRKILKESGNPKMIYLATDYDREGEAIGWHILEILKLKPQNAKRLVFRAITATDLQNALKNPVNLDMNMVYSQQARAVLDKLIGFMLCSVIFKAISGGKITAGRVVSIVTKLIIDRENEINEFQSNNYYKSNGMFTNKLNHIEKRAQLSLINGLSDNNYESIEECKKLLDIVTNHKKFNVTDKNKKKTKRNPSPPYITSSLQQDASNKLGMSPKRCMSVAQTLYECGFITYMRTDSLALSDKFLKHAKDFIITNYGPEYHKKTYYNKKKAKGAQEAHEACRPTDIGKTNIMGNSKCGKSEQSLYNLIWKRSVACQMSAADIEINTLKFQSDNYKFTSKYEKILFDGFLKVYNVSNNNNNNNNNNINDQLGDDENNNQLGSDNNIMELEKLYDSINIDDELICVNMNINEEVTKPKNPRYTEASLVKQLEKLGIGRPSTYANMVDKVQEKDFVLKQNLNGEKRNLKIMKFNYPSDITVDEVSKMVGADKNKLMPTDIGIQINDYLEEHFNRILNYDFTSSMELQLDKIAEGELNWWSVVDGIYKYLKPIVDTQLLELKNSTVHSGGGSNKFKRHIGQHPTTKKEIYVLKTRNGWAICEEDTKDKKNTRWAQVSETGKRHDKIKLEDAVKVLKYPYILGKYKNQNIIIKRAASIYIYYNEMNYSIDNFNKFYRLPKNEEPLISEEITLEQAIEVIDQKDKQLRDNELNEANQFKFEGNDDIVIKKGPYGYYIKYLKLYNVPIPKKFKESVDELDKDTVSKAIANFMKKKTGSSGSLTKGRNKTKNSTTKSTYQKKNKKTAKS